MMWTETHRGDEEARKIADRHYNRQKIGAKMFAPPGRCLVLKHPKALWITSFPFAEYVHHRWAGAWVCSAFRNEGSELSSLMIKSAIEFTKKKWAEPKIFTFVVSKRTPKMSYIEWVEISMITFVNPQKVKHKRDFGRCFLKAGFEFAGRTKGGLLAFALRSGK